MMTVGVCLMGVVVERLPLCWPGDSMGGFMSVLVVWVVSRVAGAKFPPMSSGLTPFILAFWTQKAAAVDGWLVMTPGVFLAGIWVCCGLGGCMCGDGCGGEDSMCLTGDECGRGGIDRSGIGSEADFRGGLWDLGVTRITPWGLLSPPPPTPPPPSNGPGTSCRGGSADGGLSGSRCRPATAPTPGPGVESGLGTHSDILGDAGLMRSGDEVLVSATDSPRSHIQTSHYLQSETTMSQQQINNTIWF